MSKRQLRLQRIAAVAQEYLAAGTAASLLMDQLEADPSYGLEKGWEPRAGVAFSENLDATYIVRMYAEFEAGLRDYWASYRRQATHPPMKQLVRQLIPNEHFAQDCVDDADDVREYRNFLVHDAEDEPPPNMSSFTVNEAKKCLCTYFARLDPSWR